jgi:hypothetical protein
MGRGMRVGGILCGRDFMWEGFYIPTALAAFPVGARLVRARAWTSRAPTKEVHPAALAFRDRAPTSGAPPCFPESGYKTPPTKAPPTNPSGGISCGRDFMWEGFYIPTALAAFPVGARLARARAWTSRAPTKDVHPAALAFRARAPTSGAPPCFPSRGIKPLPPKPLPPRPGPGARTALQQRPA